MIVLEDTRQVMPLSTCVRGIHGIEEDVFISMPCSIGANGVQGVVDLPLTTTEAEKFRFSASTIWNIQKDVWNSI